MVKVFSNFIDDYTYLGSLVALAYPDIKLDYRSNFIMARIYTDKKEIQIVSPFLSMVGAFFTGIEKHRSSHEANEHLMQMVDEMLKNDKPLFKQLVEEFRNFIEQQNTILCRLAVQFEGKTELELPELLTEIEECLYLALEDDLNQCPVVCGLA